MEDNEPRLNAPESPNTNFFPMTTPIQLATRTRRELRILIAFLLGATLVETTFAQDSVRLPYQKQELSLRIPRDADIKYVEGSSVEVRSSSGQIQHVKVICQVDDELVIERPAGDYAMVPTSETRPSAAPLTKSTNQDLDNVLKAVGIKDYKLKWEKPYLYVYGCSEPFFEYTRTIINSMYPGVVKQLMAWELDVQRPTKPLLVIITPSRQAFDSIKRQAPEVAAYYNVISNHIVLYEDQELADAAPEFALKQAAYTIVHEGVHQLLANTGVEKRLSTWPMWISEGLPEYLCPLRVKSKVVRKGSAELPIRDVRWVSAGMLNDLRMHSLLRMRGGSGKLIGDTVQAVDLNANGYAVAWGLVHHLATNKVESFKAYLQELSGEQPLQQGPAHQAHLEAMFHKHFDSDMVDLERSVQKHLTSKKMQKKYKDPIANQTRYVVKMVMKKGKVFLNTALITTSPAAARQFKEVQEQRYPKGSFYTVICKNQREADYEWRKFMGN